MLTASASRRVRWRWLVSAERKRFTHEIEVIVEAEDGAASLAKVERIVRAIHESDALPDGVVVRSYSSPSLPAEGK